MAQLTGTTDSYRVGSAGGIREDLEDVIWDLFADDTYCLSKFEKVDADQAYHEWLRDSLVAPTTNRQIEGDDAAFVTIVNATRLGNYQQISRKTFLVSGTLEASKKAGRKTEAARQLMKQMREMKNEIEYAIVRNQASSAGGSATARSTGSMESWIASTDNGGNGVRATTAASASTAAFSAGVTAPTDGTTTGALTENVLKEALRLQWADGGDGEIILCDATQKSVIDGFAGIATRFVDVGRTQQASIIGAASVYVTSYGTHKIVLHRHMRNSVVMCIDPSYWAISFLRRPFKEKLAKTGDGDKHMILAEWGLVCRNPDANAKVAACA
jgi:hypothetical protein